MQRLLASAFNAVDAPVAFVTAASRVVTASRKFHSLFGYGHRTLEGADLARLFDARSAAWIAGVLAGAPSPISPVTARRQDGARIAATLCVSLIDGRVGERFAVLTLHPADDRAPPPANEAQEEAPPQVVGKIRLIGLMELREALGERWPAIADRALMLAEGVIRRRIDEQDVYGRTSNHSFIIWFHRGTEVENGARAARLAREIRLTLLTEFTEELMGVVASAVVSIDADTPTSPLPAEAEARLDQHLDHQAEAARRAAEASAQAGELPIKPIFGRAGQLVPASYYDLPAAGNAENFEHDLHKLRSAAAFIDMSSADGAARNCYLSVRLENVMVPQTRALLIGQLQQLGATATQHITLLLAGTPMELAGRRVPDVAQQLRPYVQALGLEAVNIGDVPKEAMQAPISLIAFSATRIDDEGDEAQAWECIDRAHAHGLKVIARNLTSPEQARKLLELGADFLCGMQPARVLA